MVKVLMVCMGNICRSPMAEAVFQHLVEQAGLNEQIMVDSAGTLNHHVGEQAHGGTRAVLKKHHIPYNGRARHLNRTDYSQFDYILAMDEDNLDYIHDHQPLETQPTIKLFLEYANHHTEKEVPDPYYTGQFDYVFELVSDASAGLLAAIRRDHQL